MNRVATAHRGRGLAIGAAIVYGTVASYAIGWAIGVPILMPFLNTFAAFPFMVVALRGGNVRLAVARMLLRPSNTLLLDEPTNHLDLDSKEVLLDALADYGGTLIFVSHDRYFVERLATKIIEIGDGRALVYPGTYKEFLWHKQHPDGREGRGSSPRWRSRPAARSRCRWARR